MSTNSSGEGGVVRLEGETTSTMLCRIASLSAEVEENLTRRREVDLSVRPKRFNDSPTYIINHASVFCVSIVDPLEMD